MAAPTLATSASSNFGFATTGNSYANGATETKTASVAVQIGDLLVVALVSEDGSWPLSAPTAPGTTFTQRQAWSPAAGSSTPLRIHTAPVTTSTTLTVSASVTNNSTFTGVTVHWGFQVYVYRSHGGVGASNLGTQAAGTAPALSLTTTGANSAIVLIVGDWSAVQGTNTFLANFGTAVDDADFADGATYGAHAAHHSDSGAVATRNVGMSSPSTQKPTTAAVEILGLTTSVDSCGILVG